MATRAIPTVTILTPVYNEEENLLRYRDAVREKLFSCPDCTFNVLFIDDGSHDRSWSLIRDICAKDDRFQGVRLSRNFGPHVALSCGFDVARADAVATLACDLQDPPEVILEFVARWREGARIVWGKRRQRRDPAWRVTLSRAFETCLRRFAMPKGSRFTTGSFLLVDRKVAACFRKFKEHSRITFALVAWTGFDQTVVAYDRGERLAGKSGWSLAKMVKAMYDAFIGFSDLPIKFMTNIGIGISILSMGLLAYFGLAWYLGNPMPGWTSLVSFIALFFGLQFLLMGIVGEYLYRIYRESLQRPLYFVSEDVNVRSPEGE